MASPAGSARKISEELIKAFEEHKLEATHHDHKVVHKIGNSECVWKKKQMIGIGASGAVWLQEKEGTGELRAVKMLVRNAPMGLCHSRELLALVKLKAYPHLFVEFLGWYESHENMFLALEYVEGGDMSKYIAEGGPKPVSEVKSIARQILEGLEILHSLSIYHRDLKPQNILIACLEPIWVKIADFGVSKREHTASSVRSHVGTYGYMAPEVLGYFPKRRARHPAYALDMWSLGILLHEIATCKKPFCFGATDTVQESDLDISDSESENVTTPTSTPVYVARLDEEFLGRYCSGHAEFPVEILNTSHMCNDLGGINFLKALLAAVPKDRLTATCALKAPWLAEYACPVEDLKNEFRLLGVDLDLMSGKEAQKEDTTQFFSGSAKKPISSLLTQAAVNGFCLAIKQLLDFGLIKGDIIKESLRLAMKNGQFEAAGILLRNGCVVGGPDEEKILHSAFETKRVEVVDTLLQHDIPYETTFPWAKLYLLFIRSRDLDILEIVIRRLDINQPVDNHGRTPLQLAAENGYFDAAQLLLISGAHVDAIDEYGRGIMSYAAQGGHVDVVKLLLDRGAGVGATDWDYRRSLSYAAQGGHVDVVKLLLDRGVNVGAIDWDWDYRESLRYAAEGGHADVVKLLLDRGAGVDAIDKYGRGSMSYAAEGGHVDVVKLLLDRGVNVDAIDRRNRRSLSYAAQGGHVDVVKLLLDRGVNVDVIDNGQRSLSYAAQGGHVDVVKLLLDRGADVDATGWDDRRSLSYAAEGGHVDVVKLLLDRGANVDAIDRINRRSLSYAAQGGYVDVVKLLLDRGADVDATGWDDRRNLSYAAEGGHVDVVKLLLDRGVDVDAIDRINRRSLSYAAQGGHVDVVKLLLDRGADVDATGWDDRRSLSYAAEGGHVDVVKLLLDRGVDVDAIDRINRRSMSYAAEGGHVDVVKLLLDRGADVDATDWDDRRSLGYAAEGGHVDVVKLLLDGGAGVDAIDKYGRESMSYAAEGGHVDVVKLLLDRGADATNLRMTLSSAVLPGSSNMLKHILDSDINIAEAIDIKSLQTAVCHTRNTKRTMQSKWFTRLHLGSGVFVHALLYAVIKARLDLAKLFLDSGIDPTAKSCALACAAERGNSDMVKLLLDNGVDVNEKFKDRAALAYAATRGHLDIVKLLLDSGADEDALVALRCANDGGHWDIAELLSEQIEKESGERRE
ncbi:ankyrin repeat-containing domain protein [Morchella snyderi]|nr:ankyrin repeat-containing domain protein [Morchella snyderi]